MTDIKDATCAGGIVKIDSVIVNDCAILSQGTASSNGIVIIAKGKAYYLPINVSDIVAIIENIQDMCDKISAGILPSNVGGEIKTTLDADLALIKANLETFKGNLK